MQPTLCLCYANLDCNGFVMHAYNKLKKGHVNPSTIKGKSKVRKGAPIVALTVIVRKIYNGSILSQRSRGGPDTIDNMVLSCRKCNMSKGDRDPYEWYGEARKYDIPRIVLGKYLKLVYEAHEKAGTLDSYDLNVDGKLDVYDLGAIFRKRVHA